jgi:hypothetical protein
MAERPSSADSQIFISYRRDDSIAHVNGLFLLLREHFGKHRIFKDTDNIPPGKDFRKVIEAQLKSCSVLLAVIGKNWLTLQKPKTNQRRIDDPNDYLRIEVSKALQDEAVLVIPLLVGQAAMPSAEDLPSDLAQLSYLNAFELRDSRWESDIHLLIQAIESADLQPRPVPDPSVLSPDDPADHPRSQEEAEPVAPAPADDGVDLLELRRTRQIAEHMKTARAAFDALDHDVAIEACERALWLDGQNADARDLRKRARSALDEQKIAAWLTEAQDMMTRPDIADAQLTVASGLVDQALALKPAHALAIQRRHELLAIRKQRARQRDIDRQMRAAVARALVSFDEEDFDAAIGYCDDALLLASESAAARDLRDKVIAAKADLHQQRDLKRRARQAEEAERAVLGAAAASALEQKTVAEERSRAEALARAEDEQRRAEARVREQTIAADRLAAASAPAIEHAIVPDPGVPFAAQTPTPIASSRSAPVPPAATRAQLTPTHLAAAAIVLVAAVAGVWWNQSRGARSDAALPPATAAPAIANASTGGGSSTTPPPSPAQRVEGPPSVTTPSVNSAAPPAGEPEKAIAPASPETPAAEAAGGEQLRQKASERARQVGSQLNGIVTRARNELESGQQAQALDTLLEGLRLDPAFAPLQGVFNTLWRDAQDAIEASKENVSEHGRTVAPSPEYQEGLRRESEAMKLRAAKDFGGAVKSLWAAGELFEKAAERAVAARQAAKPAPTAPPAGAQASVPPRLLSEILISGSSIADLPSNIGAGKGSIEHRSEVVRGGPVSAVVWTSGCQKDTGGSCHVQGDLVVHAPDGSVFHEAKSLDLSQGGAAVALKVDARAPTGVYRVVVSVRDVVARRFQTLERQFGVR